MYAIPEPILPYFLPSKEPWKWISSEIALFLWNRAALELCSELCFATLAAPLYTPPLPPPYAGLKQISSLPGDVDSPTLKSHSIHCTDWLTSYLTLALTVIFMHLMYLPEWQCWLYSFLYVCTQLCSDVVQCIDYTMPRCSRILELEEWTEDTARSDKKGEKASIWKSEEQMRMMMMVLNIIYIYI